MELTKTDSGDWMVERDGTLLARIFMDYLRQVQTLVLFTADPVERRKLKELFVSHAHRYIRHRTRSVLGGLLSRDERNLRLTDEHSDAMMIDGLVSNVIHKASDKDLDNSFVYPVSFVIGAFNALGDTLDHVVREVVRRTGVKVTVTTSPAFSSDLIKIRFTASEDAFAFWNWACFAEGNAEKMLYIVPAYHPKRLGHRSVGSTNEDTCAFLRGKAVRKAHPPKTVTSENQTDRLPAAIPHPFVTRGSSFDIELSRPHGLSAEGVDELIELVLGALGFDGRYVSVIGSGRPPYPHPSGLRDDNSVRGSEHICVWQYRTLQAEGKLEGAIIPPWFFREDWLGKYPEVL